MVPINELIKLMGKKKKIPRDEKLINELKNK